MRRQLLERIADEEADNEEALFLASWLIEADPDVARAWLSPVIYAIALGALQRLSDACPLCRHHGIEPRRAFEEPTITPEDTVEEAEEETRREAARWAAVNRRANELLARG